MIVVLVEKAGQDTDSSVERTGKKGRRVHAKLIRIDKVVPPIPPLSTRDDECVPSYDLSRLVRHLIEKEQPKKGEKKGRSEKEQKKMETKQQISD